MITLEQAMAVEETAPITSVDISMFRDQDVENLILQRSEVLRDQPRAGRIIRAWSNGDRTAMDKVIATRREMCIRRAIAFIYLEFQELRAHLEVMRPARVADIGCGYAIFDMFMHREYGSDITLIDIETNEHKHFGYSEEGAAYTSLSRAKEFLVANGAPDDKVATVNPEKSSLDSVTDIDLAYSFVSCGYHYPYQTYQSFFETNVKPDGGVIIDIRARMRRRQTPQLEALGKTTELTQAAAGTAYRMLVQKGG